LLTEDERGVSVSHERYADDDDDRLTLIRFVPPRVEVESRNARYVLDVSRVDATELEFAVRVLKRMNFDHRFVLEMS
jgi:hypothetical protein